MRMNCLQKLKQNYSVNIPQSTFFHQHSRKGSYCVPQKKTRGGRTWRHQNFEFQCNSPVLQNTRPLAVVLASHIVVDKIIENTVGFTCKDIWNDLTKYYANEYFKVNRSVMNVNCYHIVYFSVKLIYPHFSIIWNMLMCNSILRGICLSTFSHDAVGILASPESIAGGAPNCKMGDFNVNLTVA